MRRFRAVGSTDHSPRGPRRISTTETPCALISLRTSSTLTRLPSTTVGPLRWSRGIDVLVIENQQAVVALPSAQLRVHGEEVHSVVVHADLLGLIFSRVAGIFQPGRIAPVIGVPKG